MKKLTYNPFTQSAPAPAPAPGPKIPEGYDPRQDLMAPTVSRFVRAGYGGVQATDCSTPTEVLLKVLTTLLPHVAAVQDTLAEYGVVLGQVDNPAPNCFALRRPSDGWGLYVPETSSRDEAATQIIQSLLALARGPHRGLLAAAGITPYRE